MREYRWVFSLFELFIILWICTCGLFFFVVLCCVVLCCVVLFFVVLMWYVVLRVFQYVVPRCVVCVVLCCAVLCSLVLLLCCNACVFVLCRVFVIWVLLLLYYCEFSFIVGAWRHWFGLNVIKLIFCSNQYCCYCSFIKIHLKFVRNINEYFGLSLNSLWIFCPTLVVYWGFGSVFQFSQPLN